MKKNNSNNLYNNKQCFAGTFVCRQYVDIKKNNLNNLYNNKQLFR